MTDKKQFIRDCKSLRDCSPLIVNITNYVAMNFTAGALLAAGASPLMSFYPEEMEELTAKCDALVVNIGCLDKEQAEAMRIAVRTARVHNKPWVLDPAGVGASSLREKLCRELIELNAPAVIRGNASEICCLANGIPSGRGVDATLESGEAIESARSLAIRTGSVVSMSGETDYITDGYRIETIQNGHPLMPKVTAMGCTASALTGAFVAVDKDRFSAASNAMILMGLCGETAAKERGTLVGSTGQSAAGLPGTGSFATAFIDALSLFNPESESGNIRSYEL